LAAQWLANTIVYIPVANSGLIGNKNSFPLWPVVNSGEVPNADDRNQIDFLLEKVVDQGLPVWIKNHLLVSYLNIIFVKLPDGLLVRRLAL
jgi:hypothetical protein